MPARGMPGGVRWGIIGAAGIARKAFLPAVAEAGGVAAAVAGRDPERTARWARDNGVDRAVAGYQQLIEDPQIDAVYIPLPNALHAEWTTKALLAGKPVLCEKPLTVSLLARDARAPKTVDAEALRLDIALERDAPAALHPTPSDAVAPGARLGPIDHRPAAFATAIATAADTGRRSLTGGSSGAPGLVASDSCATASAAAAIMPSLIRDARATVTPRPRPGNTSALLACAIR